MSGRSRNGGRILTLAEAAAVIGYTFDRDIEGFRRYAIVAAVARALNEELDRLDAERDRLRASFAAEDAARAQAKAERAAWLDRLRAHARRRAAVLGATLDLPDTKVAWDETPMIGQEAPAPSARSGWRSHRDLTE